MTKHATWLLLAVFLGAAGCGKKSSHEPDDAAPPASTESAAPNCERDSDCPRDKVCFLEECVDKSSRSDMLRHKRSMTPAKVRRELEKQTQEHQRQLDRGLDMDE